MITTSATEADELVEAALAQAGAQPERAAAGRWRLWLPDRTDGCVEARREDGWLALRLSMADHPVGLWETLTMNAQMRGLGKIACRSDRGNVEGAAEIPLDGLGESAFTRRIAEALADMALAWGDPVRDSIETWLQTDQSALESRVRGLQAVMSGALSDGAARSQVYVAALLGETEWPIASRPGGAAAVRLDVPGEFCQALVEQDERTGGVALRADLGDLAGTSAASREAMALLLLSASGAVRLVRAVVRSHVKRPSLGFEVTYSPPVTPTEMDHALNALSLACNMCRRELAILRDESLADTYLALHGRGC